MEDGNHTVVDDIGNDGDGWTEEEHSICYLPLPLSACQYNFITIYNSRKEKPMR